MGKNTIIFFSLFYCINFFFVIFFKQRTVNVRTEENAKCMYIHMFEGFDRGRILMHRRGLQVYEALRGGAPKISIYAWKMSVV